MARFNIPTPGQPVHLSKFMQRDLMRTGVYFLFHQDELVYVGQTKTLKWRLDQHLAEGKKTFDSVAFIGCPVGRLLAIESHYIRQYAPKYNQCGIARQAREERAWIPKLKADPKQFGTVAAADVELNRREAADLIGAWPEDIKEMQQQGILPSLKIMPLLNLLSKNPARLKAA